MRWIYKIFPRRLRRRLLDEKYRTVEAFSLGGITYYMFDSQLEVPTGRYLAAIAIYAEMDMRCDREYLEAHTKAMDKLLNSPKISLTYIAQLNLNLQERLELMPLPDFVYKLASVIFFDKTESIYSYDFEYNKKKIMKWKQHHESLDFFLNRLATELVPSLKWPLENTKTFLQVAEQIDVIHRAGLTKILSAQT